MSGYMRFSCVDEGRKSMRPSARLRSVVALDDDHVDGRGRQADLHRRLVLGRAVAVDGRLVRGKLEDDVARAARAFGILEAAGADEEATAELGDRRRVGRNVRLVRLDVVDVDARDPVALGHASSCAAPAAAGITKPAIVRLRRGSCGAPSVAPSQTGGVAAVADGTLARLDRGRRVDIADRLWLASPGASQRD